MYDQVAPLLPAGFIVRREDAITLADSEPEPDIAVVRGCDADFLKAHPTTAELVIEVAISSAALDRESASLYAEAGVVEYWIVLGRERSVEVFRQPEQGTYKKTLQFGPDATLECVGVPAVQLRLSEIFPKQ